MAGALPPLTVGLSPLRTTRMGRGFRSNSLTVVMTFTHVISKTILSMMSTEPENVSISRVRVYENDARTLGRNGGEGGLLYGVRYGPCITWRPETPPGWVPPVPSRPVGSQVGASLVGAGAERSRITAGAAGPPALESPAAPGRPRRQLAGGALLIP